MNIPVQALDRLAARRAFLKARGKAGGKAPNAGVSNLSLTTTNHINANLSLSPNTDSVTRSTGSGLNAAAIFNYQLNGNGTFEATWTTAQLSSAAAMGLTTQSATDNPDLAEYLVTWRGDGTGAFRIEKLGVDQTVPSQSWAINQGDFAQVRIDITGTTVTFEAFNVGIGWENLLQLTGETIPSNLRPIVVLSTADLNNKYVDNLLIDGEWETWS